MLVRSVLLALGVLAVSQGQAGLTLNFFGRTLGKTVNPRLAAIEKECNILCDFFASTQLIFDTYGVISLFNGIRISQQGLHKTAATKIKNAFDTVLRYLKPELLNNASESERIEFAQLLTNRVAALVALHDMMMPIVAATIDNIEQIKANPTTLRSVQDFFVYVVRPLEDTINLLLDFAQKEGEIKIFSLLIVLIVDQNLLQWSSVYRKLRDQVYTSMAAYQALSIRRVWTAWDITKWAAAGAVTLGTLYVAYQHKDTLSESMNSLIEQAKAYALTTPTWSGIKAGIGSVADTIKDKAKKAAEYAKKAYNRFVSKSNYDLPEGYTELKNP